MASTQPNYFNYPQFPPPPFCPLTLHHHLLIHFLLLPYGHPSPPLPPPSHPFAPPPPHVHPTPSPSHPIVPPPPPHVYPPPAPVQPSPSPNNHPIVIVVVFVSLGGLLFLSLLAFALCCFVKKSTKKTQATDIIHVDEHKKVKQTIVSGPFGQQAVVSSVEDDVHIDKEIMENEKFGHGLHAKSSANQGNSNSVDVGTTSSDYHHHHYHQLENKPLLKQLYLYIPTTEK